MLLLIFLLILNKIPETKINIRPTVRNTRDTRVVGTEKCPVSLKSVKDIIEVNIPTTRIINPGIPKKVKGLFMRTISNKEINTLLPCLTGVLVDVLLPVLYRTLTFCSEIDRFFSEASIKISESAANPLFLK